MALIVFTAATMATASPGSTTGSATGLAIGSAVGSAVGSGSCSMRSDDVPCVHIPPCPAVVTLSPFFLSTVEGHMPSKVLTVVTVCHLHTGLHIATSATDAHVITPWTVCDSPVFINSSMLEIFAAPVKSPTDDPQWYNEIDADPSGALWAGVSHNMKGNESGCDACVPGVRYPCSGRDSFKPWSKYGLGVEVTNTSDGWHSTLTMPFALFGDFMSRGGSWPLWRLNLYRYAYPDGPSPSFDNYELSAWSPTHDPSFHVPARFGVGMLVDSSGAPLPMPSPPSPAPPPPPYGFVDTSRWLGAEYTPSSAGNQLWWHAYEAHEKEIEFELAHAKRHLGFTSLRMFLHSMVWEADGELLLTRMDAFLEIAASLGMGVGFVFFECVPPRP